MKHTLYCILLAIAIVLTASCSSSRKAARQARQHIPVSVWQEGECVTAKTKIHLSAGKGKEMSIGGTLRMKHGDVILLNATVLFGIQVGTVELTTEHLLLVSRYTKQYLRLSYAEVSALVGRPITFADVQNIFWGDAKTFEVKAVDWKYDGFIDMPDQRRLPKQIDVSTSRGGKDIEVSLALSSYKYEDGWTTRTSFNEQTYTPLSIEQAKKLVMMLLGNS